MQYQIGDHVIPASRTTPESRAAFSRVVLAVKAHATAGALDADFNLHEQVKHFGERFIAGYRALLDAKALGFEVTAFAMVHLASQAEADLAAFVDADAALHLAVVERRVPI